MCVCVKMVVVVCGHTMHSMWQYSQLVSCVRMLVYLFLANLVPCCILQSLHESGCGNPTEGREKEGGRGREREWYMALTDHSSNLNRINCLTFVKIIID